MTTKYEIFLYPEHYMKYGDKEIKSPPLINTSFQELANCKWSLYIDVHIVHNSYNINKTYGERRVKFRIQFFNPKIEHEKFTFRFWEKLEDLPKNFFIQQNEIVSVNADAVMEFIHSKTLTPSFGSYLHKGILNSSTSDLNEYETLKKFNDARLKTLELEEDTEEIVLEEAAQLEILDLDFDSVILEFPKKLNTKIDDTLQNILLKYA